MDALHLVHRGCVSGIFTLGVTEQIVQVYVDVAGVLPGGADVDGGFRRSRSVSEQRVVVDGVQRLRLQQTTRRLKHGTIRAS